MTDIPKPPAYDVSIQSDSFLEKALELQRALHRREIEVALKERLLGMSSPNPGPTVASHGVLEPAVFTTVVDLLETVSRRPLDRARVLYLIQRLFDADDQSRSVDVARVDELLERQRLVSKTLENTAIVDPVPSEVHRRNMDVIRNIK